MYLENLILESIKILHNHELKPSSLKNSSKFQVKTAKFSQYL